MNWCSSLAHGLVLGDRELDLLVAVEAPAFALEEDSLVERHALSGRDLADPLVDLAKKGLVPADCALAFHLPLRRVTREPGAEPRVGRS